jgi:hypothetical protein
MYGSKSSSFFFLFEVALAAGGSGCALLLRDNTFLLFFSRETVDYCLTWFGLGRANLGLVA